MTTIFTCIFIAALLPLLIMCMCRVAKIQNNVKVIYLIGIMLVAVSCVAGILRITTSPPGVWSAWLLISMAVGQSLMMWSTHKAWSSGIPQILATNNWKLKPIHIAAMALSVFFVNFGMNQYKDEPIVIHSFQALTKTVKAGQPIVFEVELTRYQVCNANVTSFVTQQNSNLLIRTYPQAKTGFSPLGKSKSQFSRPSDGLLPGKYLYTSIVYYTCSDGSYVVRAPAVQLEVIE